MSDGKRVILLSQGGLLDIYFDDCQTGLNRLRLNPQIHKAGKEE